LFVCLCVCVYKQQHTHTHTHTHKSRNPFLCQCVCWSFLCVFDPIWWIVYQYCRHMCHYWCTRTFSCVLGEWDLDLVHRIRWSKFDSFRPKLIKSDFMNTDIQLQGMPNRNTWPLPELRFAQHTLRRRNSGKKGKADCRKHKSELFLLYPTKNSKQIRQLSQIRIIKTDTDNKV
jgi:hypothetical protein